jgi:putative tryptophan/tyrosine transport system substrate-binding protein
MRRRDFILAGGAALAWSPAARAQEPGRTYRLSIITGAARSAPRMAAFFDELKTLGFVEGQNLKIVAGGFDLRDSVRASCCEFGQGKPGRCFLRQ